MKRLEDSRGEGRGEFDVELNSQLDTSPTNHQSQLPKKENTKTPKHNHRS
jgi:hypothetical protein